MHFKPESAGTFLEIFSSSRKFIRSFPGCVQLELLVDKDDPCHFSTFSHWESEEALAHYRQSELFQSTWAKTKVLFDQKPMAKSFEIWKSSSNT
jgi:quinol monooxygenase YgiN